MAHPPPNRLRSRLGASGRGQERGLGGGEPSLAEFVPYAEASLAVDRGAHLGVGEDDVIKSDNRQDCPQPAGSVSGTGSVSGSRKGSRGVPWPYVPPRTLATSIRMPANRPTTTVRPKTTTCPSQVFRAEGMPKLYIRVPIGSVSATASSVMRVSRSAVTPASFGLRRVGSTNIAATITSRMGGRG